MMINDDEMMRALEHVTHCFLRDVLRSTNRSLTASSFVLTKVPLPVFCGCSAMRAVGKAMDWGSPVDTSSRCSSVAMVFEGDRQKLGHQFLDDDFLGARFYASIYIPLGSRIQLVARSRRRSVLRLCGRVLAESQRRCNLCGSKAHSRSSVVLQRREMSHQASGHERCNADSGQCLWLR